MAFIGIDIGTSFIKGAVLELDTLEIQAIQRDPFPDPVSGLPPGYREYEPETILRAVRNLLEALLSQVKNCEGVVICSQMHDLVLTNQQGVPLSNIFSWQDQRVLLPHPSGKGSYFDILAQRISPADQLLLGNELRPGQPVGLLFWLTEQGLLPEGGAAPASLPDFIVSNLCGSSPITEITHGMSHGTLNLETLNWHMPVIERLGLGGLDWPPVGPIGAVAGMLNAEGRLIPCYTPVGDYQCALAGALLRPSEISLNISTGSQVSRLTPRAEFGDFQTRPFFDGQFLRTITHIPAGRSLNVLVRLLSELPAAQHIELADPWPYITTAAAEAEPTDLKVNLAFFNSSCGDHGAITGIREEELTIGHLFRAAFQNMAENYYASAIRISPEKVWSNLVFSGGLAQKIPLLRELIENKFQTSSRLCPTTEDTLSGLLALSLVFSGRVQSVKEATDLLSQKYGVR